MIQTLILNVHTHDYKQIDDDDDSSESGITWYGEHRPRSCFWSKTDSKFFDMTSTRLNSSLLTVKQTRNEDMAWS